MTLQSRTQASSDRAMMFLSSLRTDAASREQFGVLLIDQILQLATTGEHARADGSGFDIPLVARVMLPEETALEARSEVCGSVCIDAFGHHILCLSVCHTEHAQ